MLCESLRASCQSPNFDCWSLPLVHPIIKAKNESSFCISIDPFHYRPARGFVKAFLRNIAYALCFVSIACTIITDGLSYGFLRISVMVFMFLLVVYSLAVFKICQGEAKGSTFLYLLLCILILCNTAISTIRAAAIIEWRCKNYIVAERLNKCLKVIPLEQDSSSMGSKFASASERNIAQESIAEVYGPNSPEFKVFLYHMPIKQKEIGPVILW